VKLDDEDIGRAGGPRGQWLREQRDDPALRRRHHLAASPARRGERVGFPAAAAGSASAAAPKPRPVVSLKTSVASTTSSVTASDRSSPERELDVGLPTTVGVLAGGASNADRICDHAAD
jgi:hypothetical protein